MRPPPGHVQIQGTLEVLDWSFGLRMFYDPDDHALAFHVLCFGLVIWL